MPVDVLIVTRNEYLLFRQCYESIVHKIPKEDIHSIIVVDDHSTNKLIRRYLKHLHENGKIKLIKNGIPLPSFYSGIGIKFLKGKGHGESINIGLEHVTTDVVLILDLDCIVMRSDLVKNGLKCFDLDPKVMSVGQVVGGITGTQVIGKEERKNPPLLTGYTQKHPEDFGKTNAICMFARMDSWRKYGLDRFKKWGWAHGPYVTSIFEKSFKTCNFDTLVDCYVVHLGGGATRNIKLKWLRNLKYKNHKLPYGCSPEYSDYELRDLGGDFYIIYQELQIPSLQYDEYLENKYLNLPFDQLALEVDTNFFKPPKDDPAKVST